MLLVVTLDDISPEELSRLSEIDYESRFNVDDLSLMILSTKF